MKKKYTAYNALTKDVYVTRLAKSSGVPKRSVMKVVDAMGEIILNEIAQCNRINLVPGIVLSGVLKDEDKRSYYDARNGGEIKQMKTLVRPRCTFSQPYRNKIDQRYLKFKEKEKEQND